MTSVGPDEFRREIQRILKDADLNSLSSKKVRQMLEQIFQCDFTERKKEIDDILMAEITTRDAMPIPRRTYATNVHNDMRSEISDVDESSQSQSEFNSTQQTTSGAKSDEEIAMEIHQQENRPSLRRPSKPNSVIPSKRSTGPNLKIERRRTCYNKEIDISDQLAEVVGGHSMPRSEVVKRMWIYFREHNLLDPVNKQYVNCDETLAKLFGRKRIRAFGMLKDLARHMSDPDKQ